MGPDALVFDLDGTLWDTCETCADAWNRVIARLGITYRSMTAADVRAISGQPHTDGIRNAFPGLAEADVLRVAAATEREDNAAIAEHGGHLYPGVRELVPALRARLPLAIVSNCQQGYVETFYRWSGLGSHFVDFECWGNTGRAKADNLRAVVQRNGWRAPIFVGDTEGDRTAADANGITFVHASYGFGSVSRSDHRIAHFAELMPLLDRAA